MPDQAPQQHDLTPPWAAQVLTTAGIKSGEIIVEVGAGHGALTAGMLKAGAQVHAIERDPQRVAELREKFAKPISAGQLHLHAGDARTWEHRLPSGWRVVSNPPFNLTAPLLQRWMVGDDPPPDAIDLVLQREAGLKLSPKPGEQTRTSALMAVAGRASVRLAIPREATKPASRVDLCLWSFRRTPDGPTLPELRAVDKLLHVAFAGPHTMAEALRGLATGIQVRRQAQAHGWNPSDHPRNLHPAAWLPFAQLLVMCHKL
jgi:23S rRNA (adenine-N6)-dimethyltransferase